MHPPFDAIVIGAGAAGLFCASVAGQRGLRVAVIDHFPRLAEKIRISGGGRCNFTNLNADRIERFTGEDPRFARDALRAYPPARFIRLLRQHGIGFHEKHRGQLFCDDSSERIVELLRGECEAGGVQWFRPCRVDAIVHREPAIGAGGRPGAEPSPHPGAGSASDTPHCRYELHTQAGTLRTRELVIATGGLSIPKIGASDFGHKVARQFGLRVVEPRPALVPLTLAGESWAPFAELAGVALPVVIRAPANAAAPAFDEDLLLTHRGLSGPAALQISTFWRHGDPIAIDLAAGADLAARLVAAKAHSKQSLSAALAAELPRRLAARWLELFDGGLAARRLAEIGHRELAALAQRLRDWRLVPAGTEGFRKAEVTVGGVATAGLDPRTMRARRQPGLYFVGEVVDVTGWLGGYNFQWAWASGFVAGQALARA